MTPQNRPRQTATSKAETDGTVLGTNVAGRAVLWMIAATLGSALLPLIVWRGVRDMSPYTFVALMYVANAACHALYRQARFLLRERHRRHPEDQSQPDRPSETRRHNINQSSRRRLVIFDDLAVVKRGYLWLTAAFRIDWLMFALAITLVEPVVATIVFEFWPVVFGFLTLTPIWYNKMLEGDRTNKVALGRMLTMLFVGGIGVSLVVLSDAESLNWSATDTVGILLAVLSTLFTALVAATTQMLGKVQLDPPGSEQAVESVSNGPRRHLEGGGAADQRNQTDVSVAGNSASGILAAPFIAAIGVMVSGSSGLWAWDGLMFAAAAGAMYMAASWCFYHANHLSRYAHNEAAAQINTLYYLAPVGALLLLVLFADTTIERPDLLIAGAAGVVVVNMVLHVDPEGARQRVGGGGQGYQAFVLALWTVTAVVLFRDDWLPDGWQVWSVVEYWGIVGVCATVFTLILSFRQSRLAERRRDMDALMLRLHHQIVFMGSYGDLKSTRAEEAGELLRKVDKTRDPKTLGNAYFELRKLLIAEMNPESDRERAKRLSDLLADVEVLVNLRQQGRNFTELAVLGLFAFLTVVLAVSARPDGTIEPFAGWVHDTTSVVIGSVFAFLGFDLIDKRREADSPTLREVSDVARSEHGQPPGWRLELVSYSDQSTDRIVAGLLGAILLIGAVTMLGVKWL